MWIRKISGVHNDHHFLLQLLFNFAYRSNDIMYLTLMYTVYTTNLQLHLQTCCTLVGIVAY